jgi:hypothetical protein
MSMPEVSRKAVPRMGIIGMVSFRIMEGEHSHEIDRAFIDSSQS